MNDEAGPSGTQRAYDDLDESTEHDRLLSTEEPAASEQNEESERRNREMWKRRGKGKRIDYLAHLLVDYDGTIVAQMAILYLLDCSLTRFALRAVLHLALLTPKSDSLPPLPHPTPYIGAIFGSNMLCMLCHIFFPQPTGNELTRNYLHGGAMIDFIGVPGPVSKLYLLVLDTVILLLQCVMLSALVRKNRLRDALGRAAGGMNATTTPSTSTGDATTTSPETTTDTSRQDSVQHPTPSDQDLDAEERGIHRSDSPSPDPDLDISNPTTAIVSDLDILFAGSQPVAVNLFIATTVREQFWTFQNDQGGAVTTATSSDSNAASASTETAAGRLAARFGRSVGLRAALRARAQGQGG